MGEQPLWTTRAQIFEIDRATKTSWLPLTKQTVSVSFYHDPNRQTYRIISVDGSKAILNSTITSTNVFTITAQTFGQWSDPKAGTIYGVGFTSEDDLKKFSETFKQAISNATKSEIKPEKTTPTTTTAIQNGQPKPNARTSSMNSSGSTGSQNTEENSVNGPKSAPATMDAQLKYENDKLKLALAQSSANAKKWESELQNLRNNNARLTTALQESTSNVEEWKKQLLLYQEQNNQLRTRVQELEFLQKESGQTVSNAKQLESEKKLSENKIILLESTVEQQVQEIANMTLQLSELQNLKLSNSDLASQIRELKAENERLRTASEDLSSKEKSIEEQKAKMKELIELFNKFDTHLQDLSQTQNLMRNKLLK